MLAGEVVTDLPEFAESAIFFAIEPSHLFFDIITKIQIRSFSLRYTFPENLPYFPPDCCSAVLFARLHSLSLPPSLVRALSLCLVRTAREIDWILVSSRFFPFISS